MQPRFVPAALGVALVAVSVVSAAFAPEPMFFHSTRPAAVASIPGIEIDGHVVPDPHALRAALDELGGGTIRLGDDSLVPDTSRAASADVPRDPQPPRIVPASPVSPAPPIHVSGRMSVRVEQRSDKGRPTVVVSIESAAECSAPRVVSPPPAAPAASDADAPVLLTPGGGR